MSVVVRTLLTLEEQMAKQNVAPKANLMQININRA